MRGEAFTMLAAALVGLDDTDLEVVACAAAGVIASRHPPAEVSDVLDAFGRRANVSAADVAALLACGVAQRDQLEAALQAFTVDEPLTREQ